MIEPDIKIELPRLGPLEIELFDWQMLVRQVKAFCGKPVPPFGLKQDVVFVVVRPESDAAGPHRIMILPTDDRSAHEIIDQLKNLPNLVAFGYVRGDTDSIKPEASDVSFSGKIDVHLLRRVYYIIMNRKFRYDVYSNPLETLYRLFVRVEDE